MSVTTENIRLWLDKSDPDYYIFFLKAWIPFNAWYVAEYPLLNKKDHYIIKELQDHPDSKPKQIIQNFLDSRTDHEAIKFQHHLAELHYYLEKIPIKHNNKRLSFKSLSLTVNPTKYQSDVDDKGNVFKAEKTTSYFQAYIEAKGGKVLFDYKKPTHDLLELTKDTDYIRLEKSIQSRIYNLFEIIDPKKPISLLSESSDSKDYITLNSQNTCNFISDTDTVAKACIKVLYSLRCMLFHGELAPTTTNLSIYENAFFLLQLVIKKLK